MFSRLREHLGTAGLAVAVVALVAALAGGAIAANGGATDGKATASAKKKAKKGPRGPKGPKGDTGPAGPAGPAGPQGAKGDPGASGSNGADGVKGATGNQGNQGVKGATGPTGPTGQTGYTKTLPPGETETGVWAVSQSAMKSMSAFGSISFPIPLAEPGDSGSAFAFDEEETENEEFNANCPGSLEEPDAEPGYLCIYTKYHSVVNGSSFLGTFDFATENGYETSGVRLDVGYLEGSLEAEEEKVASVEAYGSWAVTAPVAP